MSLTNCFHSARPSRLEVQKSYSVFLWRKFWTLLMKLPLLSQSWLGFLNWWCWWAIRSRQPLSSCTTKFSSCNKLLCKWKKNSFRTKHFSWFPRTKHYTEILGNKYSSYHRTWQVKRLPVTSPQQNCLRFKCIFMSFLPYLCYTSWAKTSLM